MASFLSGNCRVPKGKPRGGVWEPSDEGIAAIIRDAPPRSGLPRHGGRRGNSNSHEVITQERDCDACLGLSQSSEPSVQGWRPQLTSKKALSLDTIGV